MKVQCITLDTSNIVTSLIEEGIGCVSRILNLRRCPPTLRGSLLEHT
jgi:hypothetical protein